MKRLIFGLKEISYNIGGKLLFENLSCQIHERDRICLVGKNGAGKTTLMKMITGDIEPDSGERFLHPSINVGYLSQAMPAQQHLSVRDFVLEGLPLENEAEKEMRNYLVDIVIGPLEINPDAVMSNLSGGQVRRACLARALVLQPDILLLDEPTNHLDLTAIEWLEDYLKSYQGALICISHDRTFLANISQKVLWLDGGDIKVCPHGYGKFEEWQEKLLEQEARELQNLSKQVDAEHQWTQGGVTARRKRNVRRVRELHALREKLRQDKAAYNKRSQKLDIDPVERVNGSKIIAEFRHVNKKYHRGEEVIPILQDFSHSVLRGDKIGILGRNGAGKSSFIKLLIGEIEADSGSVFRQKNLEIAYFDQHRSDLNPQKTLAETLCPDGGHYVQLGSSDAPRPIHICGYLKRFMFDPKSAYDKVGTLSGGMQNRLLLAKILARPSPLMILDEPTNDLDMDMLDMLQEMLSDYQGTLILVSHDRDFLDRSVTEIIAFEGDAQVHGCYGGYHDYIREREVRLGKKPAPVVIPRDSMAKAIEVQVKQVATPLTYSERIELGGLPAKIEELQNSLEQIQNQLNDTELFQKNAQGFSELISDFEILKDELTQTEERWLMLEERAIAS
jgi:ABC transport system ATP-binding/permease protein